MCALSPQAFAQSNPNPYLSGESYSPYAYQRPSYRSLDEYGYQTPSSGHAYPYNHGERYSPYSYPSLYPRSPD